MKLKEDKWYQRLVNILIYPIMLILFALIVPSVITFPIEYVIWGSNEPFTFRWLDKILGE